MDERRVRRFGRGRPTQTLLHLSTETRTRRPSSTISCCYSDYKFTALNGPLFRLGGKHATWLKPWFSIGVGFSLAALIGATMVLLWDLGAAVGAFRWKAELADLFSSILFGFSPGVYGLRLSTLDITLLFLATVVSVSVHELGHAIAAASEGVPTEYVGIYVAGIFPGAMVAVNQELLQNVQNFAALRIYCAGIWHNAVSCVACGLALFLLPLFLCPFYIHGQGPMVLEVPPTSPLSGYLSPGDVIMSVDGKHIHSEREWLQTTSLIDEQLLKNSNHSKNFEGFATVHGKKGYCITSTMIEESKKVHVVGNESACPDGLTQFVTSECVDSSKLSESIVEDGHSKEVGNQYCLNAKDVVKLNKCGDDWVTEINSGSNCMCSQDESCLSPIQVPGLIWTEIAYSSPSSPECANIRRSSYLDLKSEDFTEHDCGGTFVFVGDPILMAHSILLTSYQPRWAFSYIAKFPYTIEKCLMCTFHVSLTLALLNSLPVYFLDGESILEGALCHFTLLGPRKRAKVVRTGLLWGTIVSILALTRIFIINL